MSWDPVTQSELELVQHVIKWLDIRHEFSNEQYPPSESDFLKSALFERLRSGKDPLPYPPPLGFSCPWYALIEDPGPHVIGPHSNKHDLDGPHMGSVFKLMEWDDIRIFQSLYKIVEKFTEQKILIKDGLHETPYRFLLWYDENWEYPRFGDKQIGGWLLRHEPSYLPEEVKTQLALTRF